MKVAAHFAAVNHAILVNFRHLHYLPLTASRCGGIREDFAPRPWSGKRCALPPLMSSFALG